MRWWPLFILSLTLLATAAWAVEGGDYLLAPGDTIEVTITPQSSFGRTITVQPDGKLSYPLVGAVQASGLSVEQLAAELSRRLNRHLVDPRVTVTLKELHKEAVSRVSVLGAVRSPGVFEIKDGTTVAEALAAAGGPLPLADLRRVTITRADRTTSTVDLGDSEKTGRLDRNISVHPGDLIVVPEGAPPTVLVLGQVVRPGAVELRGEMRLLDALSLAGGPTPQADLHRVTLVRSVGAVREPPPFGESAIREPPTSGERAVHEPPLRRLDVHSLLTAGETADAELNVALQPGDTIVVPETEERVYVLGRVSRPGVYPIKPDDRVLDALANAGGAASDGDSGAMMLVRRNEKGEPVVQALDLKKMMAKGTLVGNERLRAGDVLFVPDKNRRHTASDVAQLLWPITNLLRIFY